MQRISQFLNIKHGETRMVSLVIGIMLFTAGGAALGGTGIETLFIKRFGVDYLPYMFLGLGLTNMLTSFGVSAFLSRVPRAILYITLPLILTIVLIGARIALITDLIWVYPILWLGKEILNSLIGLLVWGVAGFVCDARQAKRLFPIFNASRILGQVIGGFLTGASVAVIGTDNLIYIWSGAMLITFFLVMTLLKNSQVTQFFSKKSKRKAPSVTKEIRRGFQYVRNSPLLVSVSLAAILFSVLYFSISLPFSRAATENFPDEAGLASFLGVFTGVSTAAAFLASLFIANRFFVRFGIMTALLLLPLIYLGGFGVMIISPAFLVIISFRFIQTLWLSGMADPAYQAMFNVAPAERRDQVRAFIDGVPGQAGTFIAGGLLIVGDRFLTPAQLAWIGFIAAVLCTSAIWKARRGYNEALLDALRAGKPQLFYTEGGSLTGLQNDVSALAKIIKALNDPDPAIRRVAVEILGYLPTQGVHSLLVQSLHDSDSIVRVESLRALATSNATTALLDIAASLSDPEPDVRTEAVSTLSHLAGFAPGVLHYLHPMLDDPDPQVSTRAAVALLKLPITGAIENLILTQAKQFLRSTAAMGEPSARIAAIGALGELKDSELFVFLENEIKDQAEFPDIHRAILKSLVQINPSNAISHLIIALSSHDTRIQETSASLLGSIGAEAIQPTLNVLMQLEYEDGALLALYELPPPPLKPMEAYIRMAVERAERHENQMRQVRLEVKTDAGEFLANQLHEKSKESGIRALQAIGLMEDREAMSLAVDTLRWSDTSQRALGLEILDELSEKWRNSVRPLMSLWEEIEEPTVVDPDIWKTLLADRDPWVRACTAYALRKINNSLFAPQLDKVLFEDHDALVRIAAQPVGDSMENYHTLTLMDRILFFKRVPLFEKLSPADLKQVALIAEESFFASDEVFAEEGEQGDMLYVIVSGQVKVTTVDANNNEVELARRDVGEYVGEMSVINREPRVANLTAVNDVHVLCISQKAFNSLLHDRPDVSMSVIKVLSDRLKQVNNLVEELSSKSK